MVVSFWVFWVLLLHCHTHFSHIRASHRDGILPGALSLFVCVVCSPNEGEYHYHACCHYGYGREWVESSNSFLIKLWLILRMIKQRNWRILLWKGSPSSTFPFSIQPTSIPTIYQHPSPTHNPNTTTTTTPASLNPQQIINITTCVFLALQWTRHPHHHGIDSCNLQPYHIWHLRLSLLINRVQIIIGIENCCKNGITYTHIPLLIPVIMNLLMTEKKEYHSLIMALIYYSVHFLQRSCVLKYLWLFVAMEKNTNNSTIAMIHHQTRV